jgi:hypothetical protein
MKMMMMTTNELWDELEKDQSVINGLLLRRYSIKIIPDIFIGMQFPEKLACICISVDKISDIKLSSFSSLKEIQVDVIQDQKQNNKCILIFKLVNPQHKDIFAILCEDLISSISEEDLDEKVISIVLDRFEKWKSLFGKITALGLLPEQQRGLFGELFFLRKYLLVRPDYSKVMTSWIGPSKDIRDFQQGNWAVEVKTTIGNNHQKVKISSERQLDITHLERLYLYHLSLELARESGETLPDLVKSIKDLCKSSQMALNTFLVKLYEVGYVEEQSELYVSVGYHIRSDTFYKVEGDFPRIEEADIKIGIGDVKYSIIMSQCERFVCMENEVFNNLS